MIEIRDEEVGLADLSGRKVSKSQSTKRSTSIIGRTFDTDDEHRWKEASKMMQIKILSYGLFLIEILKNRWCEFIACNIIQMFLS